MLLNIEETGVENLQKVHKQKVEKITKAKSAKKPLLTMTEAWQKIKAMNNSKTDKIKLISVYDAMERGQIGREPGSENKNFTKAEALRLYTILEQNKRGERLDKLVADTPDNYILITDSNKGREMVETLAKEPIIAVDTETTGLNVYEEKIVGVSFTAPIADKHYYLPLAHDEDYSSYKEEALGAYVQMVLSLDNEKVFHNCTFDLHMFYNNKFTVNGKVHDTMVMMHILNENEPSFRLKDLATKYLNMPSDTFDALFGKNCKFNTVALKYARYYACKDTHITWLLYDFCKRHLEATELWSYYDQVEQPLIRVVHRMEAEGFVIDLEQAKATEIRMTEELEKNEKELIKIFGDINFNSPKQLLPSINNYLKTVKESPIESTDKKVLKKLNYLKPIELFLDYRKKKKFLNDTIIKIPSMIQKDNKLHGSFSQMGTVTGRFSAKNPNLQQVDGLGRHIFKVDEDSLILGLDFGK